MESGTAAAQATDGASEQEQPEQPKRRRRRQPQRQAQKRPPQPPTQYVILQRLRIDRAAIHEESATSDGPTVDAWTLLYEDQPPDEGERKPLIIETAGGDRRAIKLATKLDDEAQRPGTFKAVPLRNWTGTLTFRNATKTVTETEESED